MSGNAATTNTQRPSRERRPRAQSNAPARQQSRTAAPARSTNTSTSTNTTRNTRGVSTAPAASRPRKAVADSRKTVWDDIYQSVTTAMQKPTFLAVVMGVCFLVVSHDLAGSKGIFFDVCPSNSTNAFCKYFRSHSHQLLGALTFVPVVAGVPHTARLTTVALAAMVVCLFPPFTLWEYAFQAGLLFLFFRVQFPESRATLVVVSILMWATGAIVFSKAPDVYKTMGTAPEPLARKLFGV